MGFTCVARPAGEQHHRRQSTGSRKKRPEALRYQQDDGQFRPPSLRDIPDHRARSRRTSASGGGGCCAAPPAREGGRPRAAAIQDEWEVWDELMRAVDEASSPPGKRVTESAARHDGLQAQAVDQQLQAQEQEPEKEPEKGRFRRLPAIALPSFPSLFAVKKPDTDPANEADAASPQADSLSSPGRASPSPRDWANQILRVRATELLDAPDAADGSVVQAVARTSTSPVDGTAPVLTATVVPPPPTVTIHVDGNGYNSSFLAPQSRPDLQRKPASGARATLVHQLAELGHTAAAAGDYEGAAATFTRALGADPDDRVGLNEEIVAAMQDAQRMARAQEEYDLDKAVEASLRDQRMPTEPHGDYRTEDENGLCCSPGTAGSSVDSAEGWDWRSLDSSSFGERSVDDISDEDVVVPDFTHDLCGLVNECGQRESLSAEHQGTNGSQDVFEPIVPLPQGGPQENELLLPPPHGGEQGEGCVIKADSIPATDAAGNVLPDPRDEFETPKFNFSFLTTHEVLDLNEWRNLHDDDTWHDFAGGIRDRRDGAYPDEWFDVVRARKDRLESLRNSRGQAESDANRTSAERSRNDLARPRLRPGCVPWESPSLGGEHSDERNEPQAPRAVRRCAFAIPSEESLAAVPTTCISDTRAVGDRNVAEDEQEKGPGRMEDGRLADRQEESATQSGALIWQPQPLTVARKVSSA